MKRMGLTVLTAAILLYMLLCPRQALESSAYGIDLWFHTLLPALLPFIILSSLLIQTNGIRLLFHISPGIFKGLFGLSPYGAYALCLGLVCGYPMGAKITADLYRSHKITRKEAEYLLMISNHPGPIFISGFILHQLLCADDLRMAAFCILYLSFFLCSLLFRVFFHFYYNRCHHSRFEKLIAFEIADEKKEASAVPLPELLDTSIMNGFETITKLGGYILLFSLISGMLEIILPKGNPVGCLIMAVNELTSGSAKIASLPWSLSMRTSVILSAASFGGLSCIFQTSSMIRGTDLSLSMYCLAKIVNGLLTFCLCRLFFFFVL